MKIIYISHLHAPANDPLKNLGGTQTVSLQILDELKQQPDVIVYPILLESSTEVESIYTFFQLFNLARRLPEIIRIEKADIVFFTSMITASLSVFVRHKIKVPMVSLNHGLDVIEPFWPYQKLVAKVFENLDGAMSVSQATRQASLVRGLHPSKSIVVPNGIAAYPNRPYNKVSSRRRIDKEFRFNLTDKYLLLSVGRQIKRKGHAWFIQEVLPLIRADVVYLLIGDGSEAEALRLLKEKSPCGDRIFLVGKVSQELLQCAYDAADLFIMPNIPIPGDMEGFGVVILEANEARIPVVASALDGIKDVICNGVNGCAIEPLNPQKFASTVNDTIDHNLLALSDSSYRHVLQYYQWELIIHQYINFFQKIIKSYADSNLKCNI
jgi:phosphatidyl-myo-inositol dimannoside synthase